jgi:hypothetical protein
MKLDPVTFARIMSFTPRIRPLYTEQSLQHIILARFSNFYESVRADDLTKAYIAKLWQQFGDTP